MNLENILNENKFINWSYTVFSIILYVNSYFRNKQYERIIKSKKNFAVKSLIKYINTFFLISYK